METNTLKMAILVDGDNAKASSLRIILEEVAKYGKVTIRRIYGDWTDKGMNSWKNLLNELSFTPIQKFTYTSGKNSTDGALIIDAMDILHDQLVDGFCIVSSDSDFTGLAKRIREEGVFVMGVGVKTTPKAFVQSCEVFTYVENLMPPPVPEAALATDTKPKSKARKTVKSDVADKKEQTGTSKFPKKKQEVSRKRPAEAEKNTKVPEQVIELVNKAFDYTAYDSDEVQLSTLGHAIRRIDPSFDVRTYGFRTLLPFLKYMNLFEIQNKEMGGANNPVIKRKS